MSIRITGYDVNGIPRVWGEADSEAEATRLCKEEAKEYLARRLDTGPLAKWVFINDANGWVKGEV